jgi:DNA-binding MarR family transcriptional regulator
MSHLVQREFAEVSRAHGLHPQQLVARAADLADGRACQVVLSDRGRRFALEAHDGVAARLESMTDVLAPDDRERLVSLTTRVLAEHDTVDLGSLAGHQPADRHGSGLA